MIHTLNVIAITLRIISDVSIENKSVNRCPDVGTYQELNNN